GPDAAGLVRHAVQLAAGRAVPDAQAQVQPAAQYAPAVGGNGHAADLLLMPVEAAHLAEELAGDLLDEVSGAAADFRIIAGSGRPQQRQERRLTDGAEPFAGRLAFGEAIAAELLD